jgi:hypothetical protein
MKNIVLLVSLLVFLALAPSAFTQNVSVAKIGSNKKVTVTVSFEPANGPFRENLRLDFSEPISSSGPEYYVTLGNRTDPINRIKTDMMRGVMFESLLSSVDAIDLTENSIQVFFTNGLPDKYMINHYIRKVLPIIKRAQPGKWDIELVYR